MRGYIFFFGVSIGIFDELLFCLFSFIFRIIDSISFFSIISDTLALSYNSDSVFFAIEIFFTFPFIEIIFPLGAKTTFNFFSIISRFL